MGLSFTQILFTIAIVVAVWRVVGMFERRRRTRPPVGGRERALEVEACPRCGTYVARDQTCPHCAERR